MNSFFARLSTRIDTLNEWCGTLVSWCVLVMALIIVYDVLMRYFFQIGSVALQELEWHLFAVLFLLSAAYTLKHDGHVRVDIFYQGRWMNDYRRAWIDLLGTLFFLLPFCILIISSSWPFVERSYMISEGSPDPGGLPFRFILKAAIPMGFLLLALQGISIILLSINTVFFSSSHHQPSTGQDRQ